MKHTFSCISSVEKYNDLLAYKKKISIKNYYLIKWPVFSKQVFVFEVQGLVNKIRNKRLTCNQTVKVNTLISKNNVYLSIPVQCPAIFFK